MPDENSVRYVRKQLSVTPEQDRAIKRRARDLGVSEAELVRSMLDAALAGEADRVAAPADAILEELLSHTRKLGEGRRLPDGWDRAALYDDRGH